MPHRRTAPAITVPIRRSYWRLACIGCLFLIAAFFAPPLSLFLFVIPLVAWYRSPVGCLQWDGTAWSWQGVPASPSPLRLVVQLDWQYGMVVSGIGSGLWLDKPSVELRRAVYGRADNRSGNQ